MYRGSWRAPFLFKALWQFFVYVAAQQQSAGTLQVTTHKTNVRGCSCAIVHSDTHFWVSANPVLSHKVWYRRSFFRLVGMNMLYMQHNTHTLMLNPRMLYLSTFSPRRAVSWFRRDQAARCEWWEVLCEARERMRWGTGLKEETWAKGLCETVRGLLRNLASSRRIFERARQHCLNQSCLNIDRIRSISHHCVENWTCLPECRFEIRFNELCN